MSHPDLKQLFENVTQKSDKVDAYFSVYQNLFKQYRSRPNLVFVEVGVKNGGSLSMWREFFGPSARIIGIDYNPSAAGMRERGFEICIADQSSSEFWERFFRDVGPIDVLLDDGGHTNKQQIVTVECALDHINDGGLILVEDTHTSYMRSYGNPSRYSFMNYAKMVADKIQVRAYPFKNAAPNRFSKVVHSIAFFESMVAFNINRELCCESNLVHSGKDALAASAEGSAISVSRGSPVRAFLRKLGLRAVKRKLNPAIGRLHLFLENQTLRKYF